MILKRTSYTLIIAAVLVSCKQTNEELINEGVDLAKRKKYKEAIRLYTKVINRNNKLQLAYYDRGFSLIALKDYSKALTDFNKVMALQTHGDFTYTENPNTPFASEEARMQVPYNDALYLRAQVKYYMDSIKSSFQDFQTLVDNNYKEKSNCIVWQGTICVRNGSKDKACEYFQEAKTIASNDEDRQDADEYVTQYCPK